MSDMAVILVSAPPETMAADDAALVKIDGREAVLRAMEMFTNRAGVVQILLTIDPQQAEVYKQKIGSHLMFMGVKLSQGGATWQEQLAHARTLLKPEAAHVLVHDAARPALPYTDLDSLTALAGQYPSVGLAAPFRGTLVNGIVPGSCEVIAGQFAELQSPIMYNRSAFESLCDGTAPPLHLIEGSRLNVRAGTHDAGYVKAMIGLLPKPKIKPASSPFEEAQW